MGVVTHGLSDLRSYSSWHRMIDRCGNPKNNSYARYGGRGIQVCERWLDIRNFVADMGERPAGMTLDRINNDGNYEPGNCRWATMKTQIENRECVRPITRDGVTFTTEEWARRLGISGSRFRERLRAGWSFEDAATLPKSFRLKPPVRKVVCMAGHPLTAEGSYRRPDSGRLICVICRREKRRLWEIARLHALRVGNKAARRAG